WSPESGWQRSGSPCTPAGKRPANVFDEERSACCFCQFLEKLLDHHLSCSIDYALADGGNCTPYLCIAFVGHLRTPVSRRELQQTISFHEPNPSRTCDHQPETRRRILTGDPNAALESAGKTGQHHVHLQVIFAFAYFFQPLTTRNCTRQDFRVLHHLIGTFGR